MLIFKQNKTKKKELQTFMLLLLGLLGARFGLKFGPNSVIMTLTVASNFNGEKLNACDQYGVCLCIIFLWINTHQRGKAEVLNLLLKLLTKWPPFLSTKETCFRQKIYENRMTKM